MDPSRKSYFLAVVAAGLLCSPAAAFSEESSPRPLKEIFDDAEQLAADPQKHDEAAARYRSVVARHRDNEQWYRAALRRLAQSYAESGQIEEGASFFIKLAVEESTTEKEKILGEILTLTVA